MTMRLPSALTACCVLLLWSPSSAAGAAREGACLADTADMPHLFAVTVAVLTWSRWTGHRRQLEALARAARDLLDGPPRASGPAPARWPPELRRVNAAFGDLAEAGRRCRRRQSSLLTDVSHQLRNPLTVLSLRMETLSLSVEGEARQEVELIREEMDRLGAMVGRLLELASARAAHTVGTGRTPAMDLVTSRVTAWRPQAESRSLRIEVDSDSTAVLLVDAVLAGSILDSILDNAVKFSPRGGRITVRVRDDGPVTTIEVADEGPGLARGEFDRIGDRFWRSPATGEAPGTGLGLSIAHELAAVLGGRLTFTADAPHGLRVAVRLPRAGSGPPGTTSSR